MTRGTCTAGRSLAAALLLAACGTPADPEPRAECLDDTVPTFLVPEGAVPEGGGLEAVLALEERRDGEQRAGEARLYFHDASTYDGDPAPVLYDSATCWRVTGQPVTRQPPAPLAVVDVRVGGLAGGDLAIDRVEGVHREGPRPAVFQAGVPLTFSSRPAPDADGFPELDLTGEAAAPITGLALSRPLVGGDLEVSWTAGDGDYLEVTFVTEDPDGAGGLSRNRVTCRMVDDGCHRIPAGALDWLTLYDVRAEMRVERHRARRTSPAPGALATLDTIQTLLTDADLVEGRLIEE